MFAGLSVHPNESDLDKVLAVLTNPKATVQLLQDILAATREHKRAAAEANSTRPR